MTLQRILPRLLDRSWLRVKPIPIGNTLSLPIATTALDVGTYSTWAVRRDGPVVQESSSIAIDAAGRPRREGIGLKLSRPVAAGRVLRRDHAIAMIRRALKAAGPLFPSVVLAIPHELTAAERRTLEQVVLAAGAHRVYTVDEGLAAGLGAGFSVMEPHARLVIDLGASATRLTVMALGKIITSRVLPLGGAAMDEAIKDYLARERGLVVGIATAQQVKHTIGSSHAADPPRTMEVDGLQRGLPARLLVSSEEVREALQPMLAAIADDVNDALLELPPQLVADVTEPGATALLGGVAQLEGLIDFLADRLNLQVHVPPQPERAVAAGLDQILRQPSLRKQLLTAASTAVVPVSRKPAQYSLGLAWFLGAMSLVLVWQAATPFMPRTAGVDQTVTAWLVPLWRGVSSLTAKATPAPLAVDPVEKQLVNQIRERDRQIGGLAAENHRLRGLLHMAGGLPQGPGHELASQVVARDSSAWLQTLVLDSGRITGAANGMAVVAESGVIGRIADVSEGSARVQTITYRGATTSASIPTRHTAGVVYGVDGRTCEMRYLDPNAGVKAGDAVLTNGLDGYPEGLAVGRVQSLRWAPDGVSEIAVVKPAVPLDSVRDVLILEGTKR